MVGVDGLEPSRCCHQWFLRPPCLPIPAHAQLKVNYKFFFHRRKFNFKSIKNKNININIKLNGAYGLVQQIKRKSNANFTKILKEVNDPMEFFPWRRMIHFNKEGYALMGDAIIDNFLEK